MVSHPNNVLLTFDDGPTEYLEEILSILNSERVQGYFFWQSSLIQHKQPVWEQVLNTGHIIGSHACTHPELPKLSYSEQRAELLIAVKQFEDAIGHSLKWFRPPHGLYNEHTMQLVDELGMKMMLWRIASWDWMHETDPEMILQNVEAYTEPGDIVLLHELPQTVKILPRLIKRLKEKGLQFVEPHDNWHSNS